MRYSVRRRQSLSHSIALSGLLRNSKSKHKQNLSLQLGACRKSVISDKASELFSIINDKQSFEENGKRSRRLHFVSFVKCGVFPQIGDIF